MNRQYFITCCLVLLLATPTLAGTRLKNICRIKGQEQNTLAGWGWSWALMARANRMTPPTMRALLEQWKLMGNPVASQGQQSPVYQELKKLKNVAMVMVTATVPATGYRRGDQVDCYVIGDQWKEFWLADGWRFASLMGPNTQDRRVYGLCEGQVTHRRS